MIETLRRPNQLERRSEGWRPPSFRPVRTTRDRLAARVRRLVDLQAQSIWLDLNRLLPQGRGRVLDVGSGAQPYRSLVRPGVTYQAIDTADSERHFGYRIPGTTYYDGDRWPVPDASVDVVLCTETLEHVREPRAFLAEAFRCLKPGGDIILTVPFAARWHFIPHDYWRFTPSGLEHLLSSAGFGRIAVLARGNGLTVACYKVMALILPLLLPQGEMAGARVFTRVVGLLLLPILVLLALVGSLSLMARGGDDCLGYTAVALRPTADDGGHPGDEPSGDRTPAAREVL